MISTSYQFLFRINIHHDYFHDQLCRELRLSPTGATKNLMEYYGLRLVERDGYIEVFFKKDGDANPFVSENTENFKLDFRLIVVNNNFYNYTNLNLIAPQQNGWLSVWKADTSQLVFSKELEQVVPKVSQADQQEGEEEQETPNIIMHDGVLASDLGLLSIKFPLAGGISDGWVNPDTPADITLNFNRRITTWRYYIIPQAGEYVQSSAKITGGEGMIAEATFSMLPEKGSLPNGTEAYVMESSEPIALRDRYPDYLKLNINRLENGVELPTTLNLPNPTADRLNGRVAGEIPTETNGFYSDQYIYL